MRIVSLVPGATDIVAAIGLAGALVGRGHECDHPAAAGAPVLTAPRRDLSGLDAAAVDRAVAAIGADGLDHLDEGALARVRPDLVITQELCGVCAVDRSVVARALAAGRSRPEVLSLAPQRLADVLDDVLRVGEAADAAGAARAVRAGLQERLDRVRERVAGRPRPGVACLEWLDPVWCAGHWVPDQVEAAGGRELVGHPGARSRRASAEEVAATAPEVVVAMPCGWDAETTRAALAAGGLPPALRATPAGCSGRVHAVDGGSLFSRPGPRVVDGVELLADVFHAGRAPGPHGVRSAASAH